LALTGIASVYQRDTSIPVFITINFVLGGIGALWSLFFLFVMVFGVIFSGDPPEEIMYGIIGSLMLGIPGLIACVVYLAAGVGMLRRRRWSYYLHLGGACIAALTCLGLAYTIPAMIIAQRPSFRGEFFPEQFPEMPLGFAPVMPGQPEYRSQQTPWR
jgi:hypothetical protein